MWHVLSLGMHHGFKENNLFTIIQKLIHCTGSDYSNLYHRLILTLIWCILSLIGMHVSLHSIHCVNWFIMEIILFNFFIRHECSQQAQSNEVETCKHSSLSHVTHQRWVKWLTNIPVWVMWLVKDESIDSLKCHGVSIYGQTQLLSFVSQVTQINVSCDSDKCFTWLNLICKWITWLILQRVICSLMSHLTHSNESMCHLTHYSCIIWLI